MTNYLHPINPKRYLSYSSIDTLEHIEENGYDDFWCFEYREQDVRVSNQKFFEEQTIRDITKEEADSLLSKLRDTKKYKEEWAVMS
jgi:hypothetical protein